MFLDTIANALELIITSFKQNCVFVFGLVAFLWLLQTLNWALRYRLNIFGIVPRHLAGLRGIPFAPILHGDFNHLFFNSVPLFVLANLMLMHGRTEFYAVSLFIVVVGGFLIWLVGSRGIHIGASMVIMGYFGFLLASAYFKINAMTVLLAIICLYYFGGLVLSLFPSSKKHISWEGHVCGFVTGIIASYIAPTIVQTFNTIASILSAPYLL